MKKSIILCLSIAVIALFSACNKDQEGVYNPSKKIQKIYEVEDGVQALSAVWNWDGDLLASIDEYSGMDIFTTTFSYDNSNRLIAMDNAVSHSECFYDGNKIQKIVVTSNGVELGSYEFEHKGSKISLIKMNFDLGLEDFDWKKAAIVNPLHFIIPEVCPTVKSAMENCSKDAKGEEITMAMIWSGNNVKTIEVNYTSFIGTVTETVDLTYDNKINPTYGLLAQMSTNVAANLFVNKNNPLTITTRISGYDYNKQTFTYEYQDNIPVKVIWTDVENLGTEDEEVTVTTRIYEY
ncbi:MAG: hypothetical protein J6T86_03085 [Bacteroidales bacterium]|nr:hypothetical protein [Bacteroidales bacterium]